MHRRLLASYRFQHIYNSNGSRWISIKISQSPFVPSSSFLLLPATSNTSGSDGGSDALAPAASAVNQPTYNNKLNSCKKKINSSSR